jgi:hypothetical protein
MTDEIKLSHERYNELARQLYLEEPSLSSVKSIVDSHLSAVHGFGYLLDFNQQSVQIEHIDAVLNHRRSLEELIPKP